MTLQLERHATQGSVAELELAQQLERRSKQPISHQAKLSEFKLDTSDNNREMGNLGIFVA